MKGLPVTLIGLANQHCMVIGGDSAVEPCVRQLLACDAVVTVIARDLSPQMQTWADEGRFTWLKRDYLPGDLRGAFMVVAKAPVPELGERIWQEGLGEGCLVNVLDQVERSNFWTTTSASAE